MGRRSFFSWVAGLFGATISDVTNFTSGGWQENATGDAKVSTAEINPVNSIKVKCGNLEVASDGTGKRTSILIDGKAVAAKAIKMSCDIRGVWNVEIQWYPAIGLYGEKQRG